MSWNPLNWFNSESSQEPVVKTGNPGNFIFSRDQLLSVMKELKTWLESEEALLEAKSQGQNISAAIDKRQKLMFQKVGVENGDLAIKQLAFALKVYKDDSEVQLVIYEEAQLEEKIVTFGETGKIDSTIDIPQQLKGNALKEDKKFNLPKGQTMDDDDIPISNLNISNNNNNEKENNNNEKENNNNSDREEKKDEKDEEVELRDEDLTREELAQYKMQLDMAKKSFAQEKKTLDSKTEEFLKKSLKKQFSIQRKYSKLISPKFYDIQKKMQQKMLSMKINPQVLMAMTPEKRDQLQKDLLSTLEKEEAEIFQRCSPLIGQQQKEMREVMMKSQQEISRLLGGEKPSSSHSHSHDSHDSHTHSHSHGSHTSPQGNQKIPFKPISGKEMEE